LAAENTRSGFSAEAGAAGIEQHIPVIMLELDENDTKEHLWKINRKVFDYLAWEY